MLNFSSHPGSVADCSDQFLKCPYRRKRRGRVDYLIYKHQFKDSLLPFSMLVLHSMKLKPLLIEPLLLSPSEMVSTVSLPNENPYCKENILIYQWGMGR